MGVGEPTEASAFNGVPNFAPVVQWIECKIADLVIEVRFLAGAEFGTECPDRDRDDRGSIPRGRKEYRVFKFLTLVQSNRTLAPLNL